MVEFQINDCEELIYMIKGTHYGGFLSFRFMEGHIPVINIGHDECIFKQYIFSPNLQTGTDGETLFIPKYEIIGIMIYAFHSREFGFGFA